MSWLETFGTKHARDSLQNSTPLSALRGAKHGTNFWVGSIHEWKASACTKPTQPTPTKASHTPFQNVNKTRSTNEMRCDAMSLWVVTPCKASSAWLRLCFCVRFAVQSVAHMSLVVVQHRRTFARKQNRQRSHSNVCRRSTHTTISVWVQFDAFAFEKIWCCVSGSVRNRRPKPRLLMLLLLLPLKQQPHVVVVVVVA